MRRTIMRGAALLLALTVSACGPEYDPLTRPGVWEASHVNRANLTLTAASPADLVRGTGTSATEGVSQVSAVERLRTDKVKKLPDSGLTDLQITSTGNNNQTSGQ